jgi:beta-ribofuranosylaminobenzene 5'-phosphate synthase
MNSSECSPFFNFAQASPEARADSMTRLALRTPSRLHFGLLSWGLNAARQFGGVGLMVDAPGMTISGEPAGSWTADGPLEARVLEFARRTAERLELRGFAVEPASFRIVEPPPEHVGLGVGTQLGLGVARLVCELAGHSDPSILELAELSGRGLRSGIGLHGFALGGLIVDGGRAGPEGIPPLLSRLEFPAEWSVLIVLPGQCPGIHGLSEIQAFAELPPSPDSLTDRLCRLVLLGLMPAVVERDLPRFGEVLEEIQQRVGQGFASVQGGTFAHAGLEAIADEMRVSGLRGVGQSSWGPTLYGFFEGSASEKADLIDRLRSQVPLASGDAFWTSASPRGATIQA